MTHLRVLLLFLLTSTLLTGQTTTDEVFMVVQQMPRFPGCETEGTSTAEKQTCAQRAMLDFIYTNLVYPAAARENGIEGTVVASFIVEKDGQLTDIQLDRGIGGGCDEEVLRLVHEMNARNLRWTPGYQHSEAVRVKMRLPVRFQLPGTATATARARVSVQATSPSATEETFTVVEEMPRFPACAGQSLSCNAEQWEAFLTKHLQYPAPARENGVEGTVVVEFVVTPEGRMTETRIIHGIGAGCDEEAMRIIKLLQSSPNLWTPGKQRGQAVRVRTSLRVDFALE
jgi:TonB family protein